MAPQSKGFGTSIKYINSPVTATVPDLMHGAHGFG